MSSSLQTGKCLSNTAFHWQGLTMQLAGPHGAAGSGPHGGVAAAVGLVFQKNGEEPTAGIDAKWVSHGPSQREAESTGERYEDYRQNKVTYEDVKTAH
ncbi:hypothetical protein QQF64_016883 [Cirrhinus molitorella]|uniref:MHC class I antigen n=1 Tax=Cirrhinus molitorella TaxID=172907 RepID=A0ABR3LSI0_9TELE